MRAPPAGPFASAFPASVGIRFRIFQGVRDNIQAAKPASDPDPGGLRLDVNARLGPPALAGVVMSGECPLMPRCAR